MLGIMLTLTDDEAPIQDKNPAGVTPTGCQSSIALRCRRLAALAANLLLLAGLLAGLAACLPWNWLTLPILACAMLVAPWNVLGLTNGVIGFALLLGGGRGLRRAFPLAAPEGPINLRTAVLLTLRNEDADRAIDRLRAIRASVEATGAGAQFGWFVLSDSSDAAAIAREAAAFARWRDEAPGAALHYRRRSANTGFKAGNVMDFCARWGGDYALMLPLDADSLMTGPAILRLVRLMQAHPRLGIVQTLVNGLPSASAFARFFQFGMRHGMRSYTMGQAWWAGDCGPFWGHNAILRIAPFRAHCALPRLPGKPPFGGEILSHDQVEAVLMRRAGHEVRVLPLADGSWEENPPSLLAYVRRDLRWCQGNLQYLRLLGLPGLLPVSRFQLCWAVMMFLGVPAWTLLMALLPLAGWQFRDMAGPARHGLELLYAAYMAMFFSAKFLAYAHTALRRRRVARYGGRARFALGVLAETIFFFLHAAVTSWHVTTFIVRLLSGARTAWNGQTRDAASVSWAEAARFGWGETLFGLGLHGALWGVAPGVLPWALPFTAGYVLAIPFAVLTAAPRFGRFCARMGLCALPEEQEMPAAWRMVQDLAAKRSSSA